MEQNGNVRSVNHAVLSRIVKQHWNIDLGPIIKASQNFTYDANISTSSPLNPPPAVEPGTTRRCVVRATPNVDHTDRIHLEMFFLMYVSSHPEGKHLRVCQPIPLLVQPSSASAAASSSFVVVEDGLVIVAFEYAPGESSYPKNRWLSDAKLIFEWGKWFARFHHVSRDFSSVHPERADQFRRWDSIHDDCLKGATIDPRDTTLAADALHYGILHGDLNCSNFFVVDGSCGEVEMHVFDWDQVQQGWFMYDVAQAIFGCVMLSSAGNFPSKEIPAEANVALFTESIVSGYESVSGSLTVDRGHLQRMVLLKKTFYETFCRRALEQEDLPDGMMLFVKYVVDWLDSEKK